MKATKSHGSEAYFIAANVGIIPRGLVRNLAVPCPMKPPNPAQGRMLTRIGGDQVPLAGVTWPQPNDVKVPSFFDIALGRCESTLQ